MRYAELNTSGHFATREECLDFLNRRYLSETVSGSPRPQARSTKPTFLFRGEAGIYPSTLPSIVRTLRSAESRAVRELLIDIEGDFLAEFEERFGERTLGLLQHYGVPTDYLEFTASPELAAFFASRRPEVEVGVIGVLYTARALEHCSILDLSRSPLAVRAARQRAFAVRQLGHNLCDYKDPECCERIGLTWFSFGTRVPWTGEAPDPGRITDSRDDGVAEWMRRRLREQRLRPDASRPEVERVLRAIEARTALAEHASSVQPA